MNAAPIASRSQELTLGQKKALISLLPDDDPSVYHTIRAKLISLGDEAVEWLKPCLLEDDPVLRVRAREILTYLGQQQADNRFLAFCLRQGRDLDIETGAWLLAQTQYPDINVEAYQALLDEMAHELQRRLHYGSTANVQLGRVNDYIFGNRRFCGNEKEYYDPDNSYLNRVLDRRTGNPVNLCLLYLCLGRRLHLPLSGIGLPGHFLCRYQSSAEELFVDPFNRGKLLTKADCIRYLVHGNYGPHEGYLTPVSPRRMLRRICGNLHQIYLHLEMPDETARFQRYLIALDR